MLNTLLTLLHVLGAMLFIGNLVFSAWLKLRADRAGDARSAASALDRVVATDLCITGAGAALVLLSGGGLLALGDLGDVTPGWLSGGIVLFLLSGLCWAVLLVPLQRRLRAFAHAAGNGPLPPDYTRLSRYWAVAGGAAILLPLLVLALMVLQPDG